MKDAHIFPLPAYPRKGQLVQVRIGHRLYRLKVHDWLPTIARKCRSCGAGFTLDGSPRQVNCDRCINRNYKEMYKDHANPPRRK